MARMSLSDLEAKEHKVIFNDEQQKGSDYITSIKFTKKEFNTILCRLDLHLLPYTIIVFICASLDRGNLGIAHARGLDEELHLKGNQFALILSLFFPLYLVMHFVASVALRRLRPRRWIPFIMIACGITTICSGLSKNFSQMAATRVILGFFEGSLTPCVTILFSSWYPIDHLPLRIVGFHLSFAIAGVIGGFLATGIWYLDGKAKLFGWQWVLILEGSMCVILSIPGIWLVPNFIDQDGDHEEEREKHSMQRQHLRQGFVPVKHFRHSFQPDKKPRISKKYLYWRWICEIAWLCKPNSSILNREQREKWSLMLQHQSGPIRRIVPFSWSQMFRPFYSIQTYLFILASMGGHLACNNLSFFGPALLESMGYTGTQLSLMSTGPAFACILSMLASGYIAKRFRIRGLILIVCYLFALAGQIIILVRPSNEWVYASFWIVAAFSAPCSSITFAWLAQSVGPQYTKMATMALVMLSTTSSSLLSSNMFPKKDAPLYKRGNTVALIMMVVAIVCTTLQMTLFYLENRKKELNFPIKHLDKTLLNGAMQCSNAYVLIDDQDVNLKETQSISSASSSSSSSQNVSQSKLACQPMTDAEAKVFWGLSHLTDKQFVELGDRHPGFRYIL